ncbi:SRPBCC family protein [Parvularcula lutaonensis]|uniref:Uncharacterized protein n=1 Tax=Parvularcula lutaonensis TaxID=491923 RepID=A0ABV7ME05_9PROT|nr:hypothetical protein [Parvularcula lutaonensis]GGY54312.1 hypothetical protein GCM10007148_24850 [Parvularcula lutaonensis]
MLECDPPHRYAHTFKFTGYEDTPCAVTYELKELDDGERFSLIAWDMREGTKTA